MPTTRLFHSKKNGLLSRAPSNIRPPGKNIRIREPLGLERRALISEIPIKRPIPQGVGNYFSDKEHYFSFPGIGSEFRTVKINPVKERERYGNYQRMRGLQARLFALIGIRNLTAQLRSPGLDGMHMQGILAQIAEFRKVRPLSKFELKEFKELIKKFVHESMEELQKKRK